MAQPAENQRGGLVGAGLFVIVGGLLQGVGDNVTRAMGSDVLWGGLGVFIGVLFSAWYARRLRWWLLLYIPVAVVLIAAIGEVSGRLTAVPMIQAVQNVAMAPECRGIENLKPGLDAIGVKMKAFVEDATDPQSSDFDDMRRLAVSAEEIRQAYEDHGHPPAFDAYYRSSIHLMANYRDGFHYIANGQYETGQELLDEGDTVLLAQTQDDYRTAVETCTGRRPSE